MESSLEIISKPTDVFLPNIGPKTVLLIDSWSGYCVAQLQKFVPKDNTVNFLIYL